jgi:hypothetical protein
MERLDVVRDHRRALGERRERRDAEGGAPIEDGKWQGRAAEVDKLPRDAKIALRHVSAFGVERFDTAVFFRRGKDNVGARGLAVGVCSEA